MKCSSVLLKLNFFPVLLLIAFTLHEGESIQHSMSSSQCTSVDHPALLEDSSHIVSQPISNKMIFMPFHKITCEGKISDWEVQATGQGSLSHEITFTVWRVNSTDDNTKYHLVGKNTLTLENVNETHSMHQLTPEIEEQISVEPGYVIGVFVGDNSGPSISIDALRIDPSVDYSSYHFDFTEVETSLDIGKASVIMRNQIPLVSATIIVDKPLTSSTTPRPSQTTVSPSSTQSSHIPTPSQQPQQQQDTITRPSQTSTVPSSSLDTTVTTAPTIDSGSDGSDMLVLIGPVVAITVLSVVIIVSTVVFVVMICHTVKMRQLQKKRRSTVVNPTYDNEKKRKSTSNQYYDGFSLNRNPSYSSASLHDYRKVRGRAFSEHIYESCMDPYEYLQPVSSVRNNLTKSLPVHSNRSTKVSAVYEIPFSLSVNQSLNSSTNSTTSSTCSSSTGSDKPCGVNHMYLAASSLVQPPPVSPGYDVPVCPTVPSSKDGRDALEESARYKEPGWVYGSY